MATYDLGSPSDMEKFLEDVKSDIKRKAKETISSETFPARCPKCKAAFNASAGENTCPECGCQINLNLEFKFDF